MVYYNTPHLSPETATPPLREVIAEAVLVAEACHADGRLFCADRSRSVPGVRSRVDQELYQIAQDFSFLYDASPEPIYAELRQRFGDS